MSNLMAVKPSATIRWARSTQPHDRARRVVAVTAVGVEADPVAELPAEHPVDRLARGLAREVPQRDLDPGQGDHEHPALGAGEDLVAAQLLPAPLDVARVLADQEGCQKFDHSDDGARAGCRDWPRRTR